MTEDKITGWHHRLNGHEFEQASGDGEGQESLACCSPWGRKESDTTERRTRGPSIGETRRRSYILLGLIEHFHNIFASQRMPDI